VNITGRCFVCLLVPLVNTQKESCSLTFPLSFFAWMSGTPLSATGVGGGRSREMSFLQACFHSSSLPVFTFRAEFPLRRLFRHPLNLYMFPLQLLNKAEFSLCLSAAHCLYSYLPQSPRWLTMACSFTGVVVVVFKGPRSH
jgi:hypothetical protein